MKGSLNQYLIRIVVFLVLILVVTIFLYPTIQTAFLSNIYINILIIFSLFFGLIFNIYNLSKLNNDFKILENFNIHKSPQFFIKASPMLKNLAQNMSEIDGRYSFKSSSVEKIIERVDLSLISLRETSRYLVGLLIFLGLLGTFWGLLKTIGSVGDVIGGLGIDDTNVAGFFNSLKDGLNAPLQGMSIAFSSSLLGLAGSLILGFMDINLGQAQNKFSQFFEKILNKNSIPDILNQSSSDNITATAIQKIYDNLDNIVFALKETSQNQNQIYSHLKEINKQIKQINNNSVDLDKKLSNFLSTQLNIQTSILQLVEQLNKNGLFDKKTKKLFENLDKGINHLISKKKK